MIKSRKVPLLYNLVVGIVTDVYMEPALCNLPLYGWYSLSDVETPVELKCCHWLPFVSRCINFSPQILHISQKGIRELKVRI